MRFLAAFLALVVAASAAGLPDRPVFAQTHSDLKADSTAKFGELPNGLRYVILPNREPRERVSLRLVVLGGSFHETEEQLGLAHFLEHMAFNGSEHYKPGTLIEFFQRMGMSFGGDTNAHTSFDHTAYLLELPKSDSKTTEEGLRVLSDYAGALSLLPDEIDHERGIILSEKRDRDSVGLREWLAEARFTLGETLLPKRLPIGTADIISQANRERFLEYYNTWYRPERLAVIAVGDFEPAAIEQQIVQAFGSLKARADARSTPALGTIPEFSGNRAFWHHEAESGATRVSIQSVVPYAGEDDTSAKRIRDTLRDLAVEILNRRLEVLAKQDNAPFSQGMASSSNNFDLFTSSGIELVCKPDQWAAALGVAEKERRRALQFGFTQPELDEASANLLNGLEQAAKTATTRHSPELADDLIDCLLYGKVFLTPADQLALLTPAIKSATPESVTAAFRREFDHPGLFLTVIGNAKPPADGSAEKAILDAFATSVAETVTAPADVTATPFAYTDFGPAGEIKAINHVADLDIDQGQFANGARFNVKKTDFEVGKVRIMVRIGGGLLTMPKDKPGINVVADSTVAQGGLGKHSYDDLRRILAGKTVNLQYRTGSDAFFLTGQTNADDLLLNLQLACAYLTDLGLRPESLLQARKQFDQFYTQLEHIPEGPLQTQALRALASGDPRFGLPTREEIAQRNLDEVRAWLTPEFARGAIEVTLVGDVSIDAAKAALAKTIGALPPRDKKPAYSDSRNVAYPEPFQKEYTFQSELPKSYVYIAWPTTDNRDITVTRQLHLLSEIFSDRLRIKIREELGDAYSPFAMSTPSDAFTGYGFFAAIVAASPDKVDAITAATLAIADEMASKGVTADEVERAKQPVLTSIREAARTNPYWLQNVLSASQEFPVRLDWRRTIESGHAAINEAQLSALAKQYLQSGHAYRLSTKPTH